MALPDFKRIIGSFQEEKNKSNVIQIGVDENIRHNYIGKKILMNEFQINRRKNENNNKFKINNLLDKTEDTENKNSDDFLGNLKNTDNSFEVIQVQTKDVNQYINQHQQIKLKNLSKSNF